MNSSKTYNILHYIYESLIVLVRVRFLIGPSETQNNKSEGQEQHKYKCSRNIQKLKAHILKQFNATG